MAATNGLDPLIDEIAATHGLPANLFRALIRQESGFNPKAVSPKGAQGLGQLMPATAASLGVRNPFDPRENLDGAARYLKAQMAAFGGNVEHALAAYNAGPGAVQKHKGVPPFAETQAYVKSIMGAVGSRGPMGPPQPPPFLDASKYRSPEALADAYLESYQTLNKHLLPPQAGAAAPTVGGLTPLDASKFNSPSDLAQAYLDQQQAQGKPGGRVSRTTTQPPVVPGGVRPGIGLEVRPGTGAVLPGEYPSGVPGMPAAVPPRKLTRPELEHRAFGEGAYDPIYKRRVAPRTFLEKVGRELSHLPDLGLSDVASEQVRKRYREGVVGGELPSLPLFAADEPTRKRQEVEIRKLQDVVTQYLQPFQKLHRAKGADLAALAGQAEAADAEAAYYDRTFDPLQPDSPRNKEYAARAKAARAKANKLRKQTEAGVKSKVAEVVRGISPEQARAFAVKRMGALTPFQQEALDGLLAAETLRLSATDEIQGAKWLGLSLNAASAALGGAFGKAALQPAARAVGAAVGRAAPAVAAAAAKAPAARYVGKKLVEAQVAGGVGAVAGPAARAGQMEVISSGSTTGLMELDPVGEVKRYGEAAAAGYGAGVAAGVAFGAAMDGIRGSFARAREMFRGQPPTPRPGAAPAGPGGLPGGSPAGPSAQRPPSGLPGGTPSAPPPGAAGSARTAYTFKTAPKARTWEPPTVQWLKETTEGYQSERARMHDLWAAGDRLGANRIRVRLEKVAEELSDVHKRTTGDLGLGKAHPSWSQWRATWIEGRRLLEVWSADAALDARPKPPPAAGTTTTGRTRTTPPPGATTAPPGAAGTTTGATGRTRTAAGPSTRAATPPPPEAPPSAATAETIPTARPAGPRTQPTATVTGEAVTPPRATVPPPPPPRTPAAAPAGAAGEKVTVQVGGAIIQGTRVGTSPRGQVTVETGDGKRIQIGEEHVTPTAASAGARPATATPTTAPRATNAPPPSDAVVRMPTSEILMDPARFQFKRTGKGGVSSELKAVKRWDPAKGGVVLVWRDPADGKTYVVNGHHRRDLAERLNVPEMDVRHIEAADAADARVQGALVNIAEGRGTPIDAAKVFRESRLGPDQLEGQGVSLRGPVAENGLALSKLADPLWRAVFMEEMPVSRGVVIGKAGLGEADQTALIKLLDRAKKRGTRLSDGEVGELIRQVQGAPRETSTTTSLFGEEELTANLALERALVASRIKETLAEDKRAFGSVTRRGRAERLERGGNRIDVEQSARIAADARQAMELFDKLSIQTGDVAELLNEGARRVARGERPDVIAKDLYDRALEAVRAAIPGGRGAGSAARQVPAADAGGGDRPEGGGVRPDRAEARPEAVAAQQKLDAAREKWTEATHRFHGAQDAYRAQRIGDEGFFAAQADYRKAEADFDRAEAEFERSGGSGEDDATLFSQQRLFEEGPEPQKAVAKPKPTAKPGAPTLALDSGESDLAQAVRNATQRNGKGGTLQEIAARVRGSGHDLAAVAKELARQVNAGETRIERRDGKQVFLPGGKRGKGAAPSLGMEPAEKPTTLFSREVAADPFFSQLARAIETAPQGKGTAAQWGAWFVKQGVKLDEMKWTGLDDLLRGRGSEIITRNELTEFVRENAVEVREVMLGAPEKKGVKHGTPEWADLMKAWDEGRLTADEFEAAKSDYVPVPAKFGQWTLPGGHDYRELVFSFVQNPLPPGQRTFPAYLAAYRQRFPASTETDAYVRDLFDRKMGVPAAGEQATPFRRTFQSGHFPEARDYVAHMRFDLRTGADGKRRMHIAEVQNDRRIAAQAKGLTSDNPLDGWEVVKDKHFAYGKEVWWARKAGAGEFSVAVEPGASQETIRRGLGRKVNNERVPDAPFLDKYYELVFKRALRWAAEHDLDGVSWDTGATVAERFDLSKHINKLRYLKHEDGTYDLNADTAEKRELVDIASRVPASQLSEHVGKDVAERIIAGSGTPATDSHPNGWQVLSGLDLKVGAAGKGRLYDRILPQFAEKYGKKWGAGAGKTQVSTSLHGEEWGRAHGRVPAPVHYLDITPKMRESVLQGQPLFSRTPRKTQWEQPGPRRVNWESARDVQVPVRSKEDLRQQQPGNWIEVGSRMYRVLARSKIDGIEGLELEDIEASTAHFLFFREGKPRLATTPRTGPPPGWESTGPGGEEGPLTRHNRGMAQRLSDTALRDAPRVKIGSVEADVLDFAGVLTPEEIAALPDDPLYRKAWPVVRHVYERFARKVWTDDTRLSIGKVGLAFVPTENGVTLGLFISQAGKKGIFLDLIAPADSPVAPARTPRELARKIVETILHEQAHEEVREEGPRHVAKMEEYAARVGGKELAQARDAIARAFAEGTDLDGRFSPEFQRSRQAHLSTLRRGQARDRAGHGNQARKLRLRLPPGADEPGLVPRDARLPVRSGEGALYAREVTEARPELARALTYIGGSARAHMRSLGPAGARIAADAEALDIAAKRESSHDIRDIKDHIEGWTTLEVEMLALYGDKAANAGGNGRLTRRFMEEGRARAWGRKYEKAAERVTVVHVGDRWLVDITPPKKVRDADAPIRKLMDRGMEEAQRLGMQREVDGKKIPLRGGGSWVPHVLNEQGRKLLDDARKTKDGDKLPGRLQAAVDHLLATGQASTVEGALRLMRILADQQQRRAVPYYERERVAELPSEFYDWHLPRILPELLRQGWLTIESVRRWGVNYQRLEPLIARVEGESSTAEAERLHQSLRYNIGGISRFGPTPGMRKIAGTISAYETASKMGGPTFGVLQNFFQRFSNTTDAGVLPKLQAQSELWSPWSDASKRMLHAVERSGALAAETALEDYEALMHRNVARVMVLFARVERGNQYVAARAAQMQLEADLRLVVSLPKTSGPVRVLRRILSLGSSAYAPAERRLERLGIDRTKLLKILREDRPLTEAEMEEAMIRTVHDTQFAQSLVSMPQWWSQKPWMRLLAKFKPYIAKQTGLIWNNVLMEARRGNFLPLARFLLWTLLAGAVYEGARDALYGRDDAVKPIWKRMLGWFAQGGGVGLLTLFMYGDDAWDTLSRAAFGPVGSTAKNAAETYDRLRKNPAAADLALKEAAKQEIVVVRQWGEIAKGTPLGPQDMARDLADVQANVRSYRAEAGLDQQHYDEGPNTLVYRHAAHALARGDELTAADILRTKLQFKGGTESKIASNLRQALASRGPKGNLSVEQWRLFLEAVPPDRAVMFELLETDWRERVRRVAEQVAGEAATAN